MSQGQLAVAAGTFIFNKEDKIFLAKFTNKFHGQWSIPGGKLDFGETPLECAIREAKEETNIDIQNPVFIEQGAFVVDHMHVVYMDFIADYPEGTQVVLNDEFSEWGFFSREELDSIPVIPKTKETTLIAMRHRSKRKFVQTLAPYNIGLIRKTVSIQDYQNNWKHAYEWVRSQLQTVLNKDYSIDHIGSTSIPNMPSKPIIDVMIQFEDKEKFQKDISVLEGMGFTYKGDAIGFVDQSETDPDRHFFSFYNCEDNIDYVHIHAFPRGHMFVKRHLNFRDKLRANPKLAEEYAIHKAELRRSGLSRPEYTRTKKSFVDRVLSL